MSEEEEQEPGQELVVIEMVRNDFNQRFRVTTSEYAFHFNPDRSHLFADFESWYLACFDQILAQIKQDVPAHYLIGLSISIPGIESVRPVG